MKVVLIAGFSNEEIRNHLTLKHYGFVVKCIMKVFQLPNRFLGFSDYGSWVKTIIDYFEKCDDIELSVVTPHLKLENKIEAFELRGVHYYFYSSDYSHFLRLIRNNYLWKKCQDSSNRAKDIVSRIKPDIVILSGAENPVTAVPILSLGDYPRLCLCQTVYNDPNMECYCKPNRLRQHIELEVFKTVECFGVYCKKHYDLLQANSENRLIFRFNYPSSKNFPVPLNLSKEYDFVNFAQLHTGAKGTPDSVKALAIVKKRYPKVTLNIVGGCDDKMRAELDQIIHENGLEENVIFTPFFEHKEDLLVHIQKSRFGVLPCKLDNTSGTMSQCMLRKIPIVVYKTTGTPAFNKVRQCALIAEMDDIEGLAQNMISLMSNSELAKTLAENGRWYKENQAQKNIDNWKKMVESFPFIIDHFKNGTPIPQEKLYNPDNDQ